jgi:asparagine synthase (glutamine-hydrolysing)
MKLGVLFSGGKDSTLALAIAMKEGYEIACLISVCSKNKDSYMFHTPSIEGVKLQAKALNLPIIFENSEGKKEDELKNLERAILTAKETHGIEGVISGAVLSVYQSTRIQKICNKLKLEVFNPLWQRDQEEILKELISKKFDVRIVGVCAYPFNKSWLGRKIDKSFLEDIKELNKKWGINLAGEGGEFESFVLDCPLFKRKLKIFGFEDFCSGENSCRRELKLEIK